MVNKCLVSLPSNQRVFEEEKPLYEKALKDGRHPCNLVYNIPSNKKRNRVRKPIYYNPPFSLNVRTNVAAEFLKLIDKHFPNGSMLHKHLMVQPSFQKERIFEYRKKFPSTN